MKHTDLLESGEIIFASFDWTVTFNHCQKIKLAEAVEFESTRGLTIPTGRIAAACLTGLGLRFLFFFKMAARGSLEIPRGIPVPTRGVQSHCLAFRLISPEMAEREGLETSRDGVATPTRRLPTVCLAFRLTAPSERWRRGGILKSYRDLRPLLAVFEAAALPLGLPLRWWNWRDSNSH